MIIVTKVAVKLVWSCQYNHNFRGLSVGYFSLLTLLLHLFVLFVWDFLLIFLALLSEIIKKPLPSTRMIAGMIANANRVIQLNTL